MPRPPPARARKSRRSQIGATRPHGNWLRAFIGASVDIKKLVGAEQGLAKVGHSVARTSAAGLPASRACRRSVWDFTNSIAPDRSLAVGRRDSASSKARFAKPASSPPSPISRPAISTARARTNASFNSDSACGATVVWSRRPQACWASGRSNACNSG